MQTVILNEYGQAYQKGFSDEVALHFQNYVTNSSPMGWLGHRNRKEHLDRALEKAMLTLGIEPRWIAEWVCSRYGRHALDNIKTKADVVRASKHFKNDVKTLQAEQAEVNV